MKNNTNILCSCCINAYKRPELLKKLISSLSNQKLGHNISLEIIVVDNDPDKRAEKIVESMKQETLLDIKYFKQPIKNISFTRNKAVSEAKGEFILFIDDDGYAVENWLDEFVKCLFTYNADAVFGTVVPYYEEGVPDWIKKGGFFNRLIQNTGEISKFTRTTNCIIKSALLKSLGPAPFDPIFGLTGGEDINLFGKLSESGAKFIFCEEAIVYDFVPLNRANLGWLSRRTFRTGITFTERVINKSKYKSFRKFYEIFKGIIYIFISIMLMILYLPIKHMRCHWYLKIISNMGHIAAVFNLRYEEYKN